MQATFVLSDIKVKELMSLGRLLVLPVTCDRLLDTTYSFLCRQVTAAACETTDLTAYYFYLSRLRERDMPAFLIWIIPDN